MLSSETTAAAKGELGKIRHDPFAMLPFCGYHMGDYFKHWIELKKASTKTSLPHFFCVNWFLKDEKDQFIWPGYQENMRVIEWIFRRIEHKRKVEHTIVGNVPLSEEFNFEGLNLIETNKKKLFEIDPGAWKKELLAQKKYLAQFEPKLPDIFFVLIDKLIEQLGQ
jgi:phosphoenolpyruvate carboxykinase (GTP)